jgi:hypothetical protein
MIQIRNVPEHVHRIYRARAAAAGMSLQEYVLAELVNNAASRSPAEIIAEVERGLTAERAEVERGLTAEGVEVERGLTAEGAEVERELTAEGAEVERELTAEGAEVEPGLTAEGVEVEREMAAEGEERYFDGSAQEIADIIRGDRESH